MLVNLKFCKKKQEKVFKNFENINFVIKKFKSLELTIAYKEFYYFSWIL